MTYVDILLPIALPPLTYHVGEGVELREGMAVMVNIGPRKLCQGIVWKLHLTPPTFLTKPIGRIIYTKELLDSRQMRLWEWMADYYMCSLGEIMAYTLPSLLKPEGFSAEEFARDSFRPTQRLMVGLAEGMDSQRALGEALDTLQKRAKRQYEALLEIANAMSEHFGEEPVVGRLLPRTMLQSDSATLKKLSDKNLISLIKERETQAGSDLCNFMLPRLTPAQTVAMESIYEQMAEKSAILLHGVTGSGKTEIFINMAARELSQGKSVLYLLPEIPICWQIIDRLGEVFGEHLVAYHSKFSLRHRAEIFFKLSQLPPRPRIYIGTRMAVMLPVKDVGLVIVDEEHDTTFKQESPAPRFHARDAALMLAWLHGATTILGSATPSMESYHNTITGKYGLVTLRERYGGIPPPHITLSDTLKAVKRGERHLHFNKVLLDKIGQNLKDGTQTILFQNRRGFSPYVECGGCAWVAHCPDCSVSLTLHKSLSELRCHYCGYRTNAPRTCPSCNQGELLPKGFGTEKIEEELAKLFPDAHTDRLDSDTASSPRRAKEIISNFEQGQTDILVGTQMVTKGFDFKGVKLVGVVNADNLLNFPDFRASERAFQMLTQAAGRAGRHNRQGEVVIQTSQPDNPILARVVGGDYGLMAQEQLSLRKELFYPPYCRLVSITLRHSDKALLDAAARSLASLLRPIFAGRLLGPVPPLVDRIMGENILTFMLKIERDRSFAKARRLLQDQIEKIKSDKEYKKVTVICNVDPQ